MSNREYDASRQQSLRFTYHRLRSAPQTKTFRKFGLNFKLATSFVLALSLSACQHSSIGSDNKLNKQNHIQNIKTVPTGLKHRWQVVQFLNYSPSALKSASLDLTLLPRANAYAGCNQIMFEVTTTGSQFIVGNIMSTRMACMNNTLEKDLISALKHAKTYHIHGNSLNIQTHQNQMIVLSR